MLTIHRPKYNSIDQKENTKKFTAYHFFFFDTKIHSIPWYLKNMYKSKNNSFQHTNFPRMRE